MEYEEAAVRELLQELFCRSTGHRQQEPVGVSLEVRDQDWLLRIAEELL